jgi:hypothetical protein
MSDWTDLDLPVPETTSYGYTVDAGLQRTPFSTANPKQRRKYETNKRIFSVAVQLTQAQLAIAESNIQLHGYTWFTMPLLSGRDETDVVSDHSVRLIDNYQVSAVGWNLYKLSMTLEDRVDIDLVCTKLVFELETLQSPFPAGSTASVGYHDLDPPSIDMTPVSNTKFIADLSEWLEIDVYANFTVDFNGGTWQPAEGEGLRATLTFYDQNDDAMWDLSVELYTTTGGYLAIGAYCGEADIGGAY